MFKKVLGAAVSTLLSVSLLSGAIVTAGAVTRSRDAATEAALPSEGVNAQAASEEMAAYLFVHFIDEEQTADKEQIYFSVSKDGTSWTTLNEVQPVLRSEVGERGVRDPHIIRKPDGSGFYMIATDLSIYNINGNWTQSQTAGSQSIVVWESVGNSITDWECKGLKKISRDNAGCTWAPESIWDDERQAYMVFWASKTAEDYYSKQRVYRCYTTDFETFTEPEVYIEGAVSMIDTTFIKEGDTYYRFTKDEDAKFVYMEKSKSLSGPFEAVNTYTLNGAAHTTYTGYEGPTAYKLNGEEKWCLLLDNWDYKPFITDDITTGRFVSASAFDFDGVLFRHGCVIPITQAEYDALVAAWPSTDADTREGALVYALDFENGLEATTGANATEGGSLTFVEGVNGGKAVQLSANNYVSIGGSVIAGLSDFTVSFAAKVTGSGNSWLFYAAPNANEQVYNSEKYLGALYKSGETILNCERYNNSGSRSTATDGAMPKGEWAHVTLVYGAKKTQLFINGERVATVASSVNLANMLGSSPVIYLGKANWGSGEYAEALLDCFKIHNYSLSTDEIAALYKSDMGIA